MSEAESWYIALGDVKSTKFVQMINLGSPFTFLLQAQSYFLVHWYGEDVVKSFSQSV